MSDSVHVWIQQVISWRIQSEWLGIYPSIYPSIYLSIYGAIELPLATWCEEYKHPMVKKIIYIKDANKMYNSGTSFGKGQCWNHQTNSRNGKRFGCLWPYYKYMTVHHFCVMSCFLLALPRHYPIPKPVGENTSDMDMLLLCAASLGNCPEFKCENCQRCFWTCLRIISNPVTVISYTSKLLKVQ